MMLQGSTHSCVEADVAAKHWNVSSATVPFSRLEERCAHFSLVTATFNATPLRIVQSGVRCQRNYGASGGSCWFCPRHGGCPANSVGHWNTVSGPVRQLLKLLEPWKEAGRFRRVGPHSARESTLVSALLEVKSSGNWRPRENLNHHGETQEWELDDGFERKEPPAAQQLEARQKGNVAFLQRHLFPCWRHAPCMVLSMRMLARPQYRGSIRQLFLYDNLGIVLAFERCRSSDTDSSFPIIVPCAWHVCVPPLDPLLDLGRLAQRTVR